MSIIAKFVKSKEPHVLELKVTAPVPEQHREITLSQSDPIQYAVGQLFHNNLVIYHNRSVYAVLGNANSPTLLEDMRTLKKDEERIAVGWTVDYERALPFVDPSATNDEALQSLLQDPHKLTARAGGIAFVRAKADMKAKEAAGISDVIIPRELETVQIWSPTGSNDTSRLVRMSKVFNIEPVMSSANFHGQAEIITAADAHQFAAQAEQKPYVFVHTPDEELPQSPLGSFPILNVAEDGLELVRAGCFEEELIYRIFDGYMIRRAANFKDTAYPDNQLRLQDLPEAIQKLRGPELRLGVLAVRNWDPDADLHIDDSWADFN